VLELRKSRILVFPAIAALSILTSCGNSTVAQPDSIKFTMELWGSNFEKTDSGNCRDTEDNYRNNNSITLIGPDDSEISTATLGFGELRETTVSPEDVTNFPDGKICYFEVDFPNVPDVATYRIKTRDGVISGVSYSRQEIIDRGWEMGLLRGAEFKD
jgi:hypothetical protein